MSEIALAGPTFDEVVAAAVMDASGAAFDPLGERPVRRAEVIKVAAGLVQFLKAVERNPGHSFSEWRVAIESLRIELGTASR